MHQNIMNRTNIPFKSNLMRGYRFLLMTGSSTYTIAAFARSPLRMLPIAWYSRIYVRTHTTTTSIYNVTQPYDYFLSDSVCFDTYYSYVVLVCVHARLFLTRARPILLTSELINYAAFVFVIFRYPICRHMFSM